MIDLAFKESHFYMREIDIEGFTFKNPFKTIEYAFNIDTFLVSTPRLSCIPRSLSDLKFWLSSPYSRNFSIWAKLNGHDFLSCQLKWPSFAPMHFGRLLFRNIRGIFAIY